MHSKVLATGHSPIRVAEMLHTLRNSPSIVDLSPLSLTSWIPAGESSCVLRSYHLPAGLDYDELHDGLKRQGFIIYAGQGGLAEKLFRVSTMGEIGDYDMERLTQALQMVISGTEKTDYV